jgi:hypothetical protein
VGANKTRESWPAEEYKSLGKGQQMLWALRDRWLIPEAVVGDEKGTYGVVYLTRAGGRERERPKRDQLGISSSTRSAFPSEGTGTISSGSCRTRDVHTTRKVQEKLLQGNEKTHQYGWIQAMEGIVMPALAAHLAAVAGIERNHSAKFITAVDDAGVLILKSRTCGRGQSAEVH